MQTCLEIIPAETKRVFVAFSGGLDSSVLLHLLVAVPREYEVIPWHINHRLLDNADQMEQFCVDRAGHYKLPIKLDRLELGGIQANIEAAARRQRYQLFERQTEAQDCVLTAHHADDQAETFLLNALRSSGSAGLRGIARERSLGKSRLLRPLLTVSRKQIESYALKNEISWFEDPSNREDRFDRNFLRNQVIPVLNQRWPQYQRTLGTATQHQAEIHQVLDELATEDFNQLAEKGVEPLKTLRIEALTQLSLGRRKNVIRHWIKTAGMAPLPLTRLEETLKQIQSKIGSMPEIAMPNYSIRIYDDRLHLVPKGEGAACCGDFLFGQNNDIEIAPLKLKLARETIFTHLDLDDQNQELMLRFRKPGGENSDRHRLKRLFQRHRVPPWQRASVAQIYLDGHLKGILW